MADEQVAFRETVARKMLADELHGTARDFDVEWKNESAVWLANADSALAAVADMLRSGGETVRGQWYAWDSEQRGYANGFADRLSPALRDRGAS